MITPMVRQRKSAPGRRLDGRSTIIPLRPCRRAGPSQMVADVLYAAAALAAVTVGGWLVLLFLPALLILTAGIG